MAEKGGEKQKPFEPTKTQKAVVDSLENELTAFFIDDKFDQEDLQGKTIDLTWEGKVESVPLTEANTLLGKIGQIVRNPPNATRYTEAKVNLEKLHKALLKQDQQQAPALSDETPAQKKKREKEERKAREKAEKEARKRVRANDESDEDKEKTSARQIARDQQKDLQRIVMRNAEQGVEAPIVPPPSVKSNTSKRNRIDVSGGEPVDFVEDTKEVEEQVEQKIVSSEQSKPEAEPVQKPVDREKTEKPKITDSVLINQAKSWERYHKRTAEYLRSAFAILEKDPTDRGALLTHLLSNSAGLKEALLEDAYPFFWNEKKRRRLPLKKTRLFDEILIEAKTGKPQKQRVDKPEKPKKEKSVEIVPASSDPNVERLKSLAVKGQAWEKTHSGLAHRLRRPLLGLIKELSSLSDAEKKDEDKVAEQLMRYPDLLKIWNKGEGYPFIVWQLSKVINADDVAEFMQYALVLSSAELDKEKKEEELKKEAEPAIKTEVPVVEAPEPKPEKTPEEIERERREALLREREAAAKIEHEKNRLLEVWKSSEKRLKSLASIVAGFKEDPGKVLILDRCQRIGRKLRVIHDDMQKPDLDIIVKHSDHLKTVNEELTSLEDNATIVEKMRHQIEHQVKKVTDLFQKILSSHAKDYVLRNRDAYPFVARAITQSEGDSESITRQMTQEIHKLEQSATEFSALHHGHVNALARLKEAEELFNDILLTADNEREREAAKPKGFFRKLFT